MPSRVFAAQDSMNVMLLEENYQRPTIKIAISLFEQIYQNIGMKLNVQVIESGDSLILSNTGLLDGELLRFENAISAQEFPNLIAVSPPFLKTGTYLVCAAKASCELTPNQKLGYLAQTKVHEKFCTKNLLQCQAIPNMDIARRMLNAGIIDGLLLVSTFTLSAASNYKNQIFFVRSIPSLNLNVLHYVHKKYEQKIPEISAQLLSMHKQNIISEKYKPFDLINAKLPNVVILSSIMK